MMTLVFTPIFKVTFIRHLTLLLFFFFSVHNQPMPPNNTLGQSAEQVPQVIKIINVSSQNTLIVVPYLISFCHIKI